MTDIKARLTDWGTVYPEDEDEGALYIAARDRIEELEAKLATARNDALEEAAKACDSIDNSCGMEAGLAATCADAISALKSTTQT